MNPELEQVFLARGLIEAEIIKGKLESNDIPVLLQYESTSVIYGLTLGSLGEVHVLVPVEMAALARELLVEETFPEDSEAEEVAPEDVSREE